MMHISFILPNFRIGLHENNEKNFGPNIRAWPENPKFEWPYFIFLGFSTDFRRGKANMGTWFFIVFQLSERYTLLRSQKKHVHIMASRY